jgi:hypothetical protein
MLKNGSSLISLLLSVALFVACTSSSSVPLQGPSNPPGKNPGEQGGEAQPTPTPSPNPSPTPGKEPSPTPPPASQKVARVYCTGNPSGNSSLHMLPANASENFYINEVRLFTADGTKAEDLKNPTPLTSDGIESFLIVKAKMIAKQNEPWKIYKAHVDILKKDGTLELLSTSAEEANQYAYDQLKLVANTLGANGSRNAYVYPNSKGGYVLEDMSGGKSVLPFTAESSSNPQFSGNSWIAFDQEARNYSIVQKFYSVKSGKTVSIPSASESRDYQLSGFVSSKGTFFWIEGRPSNGWKLKSSSSGSAVTVASLAGSVKNIVLPAVIFERNGQVNLAYLEEDIAFDTRAKPFVKTGLLHVLTLSSSLKVLDNKSIEYSEDLKNMILKNIGDQQAPKLLRSLFFEPLSGQLYTSVVAMGGLASYNLEEGSWALHGSNDFNGCLNPAWGVEVPRE